MKFNKAKCKVPPGWGSSKHKCRLGSKRIESSLREDLEYWWMKSSTLTWLCALTFQKANSVLGLHQKQCGQKVEGGDSVPLVCLCETIFDLKEQSRKQY